MTTGLAQSIERLTAEQEVVGLITGAGPIVHFTVTDVNEAEVDLVLIQPFLATKYSTWKNGRRLSVELDNKMNKQNAVSMSND